MILTTTQQIEGHTIREYKAPIKREKSDARINSSERNAIVGIDIDYETIGETRSALPLA